MNETATSSATIPINTVNGRTATTASRIPLVNIGPMKPARMIIRLCPRYHIRK